MKYLTTWKVKLSRTLIFRREDSLKMEYVWRRFIYYVIVGMINDFFEQQHDTKKINMVINLQKFLNF